MTNLNKLLIKIFLSIVIGILLIIGICCLVGFTVGGAINLVKMLLFFAASILLGGLFAKFVMKGTNNENKVPFAVFVVTLVIFYTGFYYGYGWLNNISAENQHFEYQSTVTAVSSLGKDFHDDIYFNDSNGQEQMVKTYYVFRETYHEGDTVTVTERMGGFGYPIYELSKP